ncbi:hypothetical protein PR048_017562 [Dryococelus australis]|uniref:GH18 domain-containing protein n=1 Tax=Dryococelus australis TaxID=614101 RepID=A0ABQ9H9X4_9NEOP|nr:hypothetical protein PR048_017562 [Dryococelus australis]
MSRSKRITATLSNENFRPKVFGWDLASNMGPKPAKPCRSFSGDNTTFYFCCVSRNSVKMGTWLLLAAAACLMRSASSFHVIEGGAILEETESVKHEKVMLCYMFASELEASLKKHPFPEFLCLCSRLVILKAELLQDGFISVENPMMWKGVGIEELARYVAALMQKLLMLRMRLPHLKVVVSVRGGAAYSMVARNPLTMLTCSRNLALWQREYGCDGFEIDWQYPGIGSGSSPMDRVNLPMFLRALEREMDKVEGDSVLMLRVGYEPSLLTTSYIPRDLGRSLGEGMSESRDIRSYIFACASSLRERWGRLPLSCVEYISLDVLDMHDSTLATTGFNAPLYYRPGDKDRLNNVVSLLPAVRSFATFPNMLRSLPANTLPFSPVLLSKGGIFACTMLLTLFGATVAERLACSPPNKGDPGSILGRVTPDFGMWEFCRALPLVGGFSQGSPVSPILSFRRCSIPQSHSSALKTSLALVYATRVDNVDTLRDRIVAGCETIRSTPGIHQHIQDSMQQRVESCDAIVKLWKKAGMPLDKMVVNVPVFGTTYQLANDLRVDVGAPTVGPGPPCWHTQEAGVMSYKEVSPQAMFTHFFLLIRSPVTSWKQYAGCKLPFRQVWSSPAYMLFTVNLYENIVNCATPHHWAPLHAQQRMRISLQVTPP